MKVEYIHDAAENPDASSWSPLEQDEPTTMGHFDRFTAPRSFIHLQIRDHVSASVTWMSDDTWDIGICYSDEERARSGRFSREVARSFVAAAFHEGQAEALADRLGLILTDIPPDPGWTAFHPDRSHLREDGAIVMQAGGYAPGSGMWDGTLTIDQANPDHALWLWIRAQPKYQQEDATVYDRDLEGLRKEFAESVAESAPDESKA